VDKLWCWVLAVVRWEIKLSIVLYSLVLMLVVTATNLKISGIRLIVAVLRTATETAGIEGQL